MPLDWDKLRVFHAAAQAGSFTHASEALSMSQSAVSRQISALEQDIGVSLFNRHARGLVLTEAGERLRHTAHDVYLRLESVKEELQETRETPTGTLRVTTTVGLGAGWLTYRVQEFLELYPDMNIQLVLSNEELDLNMREADCAVRLRQPRQPDLIQRRLFTVHMHMYCSPGYIEKHGKPETVQDLDNHSIITFGEPAPDYLTNLNSLLMIGRPDRTARVPRLEINSIMAIKRALQRGAGIAMMPDYAIDKDAGLVRVLEDIELPSFDTYFAYADSMRNNAKLKVFRDFLVTNARDWKF